MTPACRARPAVRRGALSALFAAALLLVTSCTVRLIADYDEHTFNRTAEIHEQVEGLFVSLEDAAATPDPADDLYPAHAAEYLELVAALRALQARAETLDKNEITAEQVSLLRDSLEAMQSQHRERSSGAEPKGFSAEALRALREPVVQQFRSILTLQEALKR
jgi:hypothetical protein